MPPSGSVTPMMQDRAPAGHHDGRADPRAEAPGRVLELGDEVADGVLQHEAGHAGSGVDGGQDEQRLEHDGEVVPEAIMAVPPTNCCMMWARPTARVGAPPVRETMVSSPTSLAVWASMSGRDVHAGQAQGVDQGGRALNGAAGQRRRGVHGEVDAAVDGEGRDERHDRHEGLHEHAAVADEAGLAFLLDQLGRGAGGDQGVEAGQGAAGDGDEQEREQRAGEHRAVVAAGELAEGRDGDFGADQDDGQRPASRWCRSS